jgi:hypothetical protein
MEMVPKVYVICQHVEIRKLPLRNTLLGIHLKECKSIYKRAICIPNLIAALLTIAKL